MYQVNHEHRATIKRLMKAYAPKYVDRYHLTVESMSGKRITIELTYSLDCISADLRLSSSCSRNLYRANHCIYGFKPKFIEAYRKDIEDAVIVNTDKKMTEEEQRQFITALINLFEPEDTGLTKRAL